MDTLLRVIGILVLCNADYLSVATSTLATNSTGSCGVRYLRANDQFKFLDSPGYLQHDSYEKNMDCTWTILADNSSKVVYLETVASSIEFQSDCRYDSVTAYDGPTNMSRTIKRWCGTETPAIWSTGRYLTLLFKTDNSIDDKGFRLRFQQLQQQQGLIGCGGHLSATEDSKYFTSPGYPSLYKNNHKCTWTIRTTHKQIKLVVTDSHLEYSNGCTFDGVKVYNGQTNKVLGSFCGYQKPTYTSSSSVVKVIFFSNTNRRYKGFRMKYTGGSFSGTQACGAANLTSTRTVQFLTSPRYPNGYANYLDCKWVIEANSRHNIQLIVLNNHMKSSTRCQYDAVKVYDGSATSASLLGTLCGSQTSSYVSSGYTMTVTFKTDESHNGTGFRLSYQSGHYNGPSCGHSDLTSLLSETQQIVSPLYPLAYPNDADCTWSISTGVSDWVVYIEITGFEIEYNSSCSNDYLQAFDDRNGYGRSLGKWCGVVLPPAQQSSGQYMFLKFHSDGSVERTGFKLEYSSKGKHSKVKETRIGAIAGGIAAGCVLFLTFAFCVVYRARKKGSRTQTPRQSNQTRLASSQRVIFITGGNQTTTDTAQAMATAPPSYNEVHQAVDEAPPPLYNSLNFMANTEANNSFATGVGVDDDTESDAYGPGADTADIRPIMPRGITSGISQGIDNPVPIQ